MSHNILLVDDDSNQSQLLEKFIHDKLHYNTRLVKSGQEAIDLLTSGDSGDIDLVLLDLSMPGIDGVQVLNAVKPVKPNLPIIVRTGYDDVDMAIESMKAGATDFIKKIDKHDKLEACINNALRMHVLNDELSALNQSHGNRTTFNSFIGSSPAVKEMLTLGQKVAGSDIPVLVEGESGSGKEFIAMAIHNGSRRKDKPFIAVNCGAIPENLVESILFGHEKGAFTGALYKTFGKFREADGGTIFLDEIGELQPDIQVKLLRVLQDGEIDPVGSKRPIKVDVRVISATNKNLSDEVRNHNFREDLFYRLSVFPIYSPALKNRIGDVEILLEHFIKSFAQSEHKEIKGISQDAKNMLAQYSWPGNIRQLKNTIFRAVVLCEGNLLDINDFPQILQAVKNRDVCGENIAGSNSISPVALNFMQNSDGNFKTIIEIEKEIITKALSYYDGRMSEIARRLGIGRSTLYRKIEEYGIINTKE